MRILHYSLGFPPYRTGGLTKFSLDLMREQVKEGHNVGLLWPGEIKLLNHRIVIRKRKAVDGISNYEVINPLPVSFDEGIKDFDVFMQEGNKKIYEEFLSVTMPDVIHVHTLMGLHKNFLIAAKEKRIRLVFTTHDFFPICPKVTMFRHGQVCNSVNSCEECGICNNTALSLKKIQILQSPIYRIFKCSSLVKSLRKHHRDKFLSDCSDDDTVVGSNKDYLRLRDYYYSMLKLMDVIHCNSTIARSVYEEIFGDLNYQVISITHSNISDCRKKKNYNHDVLRIRYLGPQSAAKGYYVLKKALDQLWENRHDFVLDVHFTPNDVSEYIRCHGRYDYDDLEDIFEKTDVLICPSIWYETFGFTVLEAVSYGVPVIVSCNVGAQDILEDGCGVVYEASDVHSLISALEKISRHDLQRMNNRIIQNQRIVLLKDLENSLNSIYQ